MEERRESFLHNSVSHRNTNFHPSFLGLRSLLKCHICRFMRKTFKLIGKVVPLLAEAETAVVDN